MFLNIYYCIQCVILTHTWHISISPLSMRLSVSAIHHHEPLSLPKNVETNMISPLGLMASQHLCESTQCRKSNHTSENDVTSSSKILRLKYMIYFSLICSSTSNILYNVEIQLTLDASQYSLYWGRRNSSPCLARVSILVNNNFRVNIAFDPRNINEFWF
jgi:hypothetical protein